MSRVSIPFVGAAYKSASLKLDAQLCINWYPEMGGPSSKAPIALFGTPGTLIWHDTGLAADGRALYRTSTGRLFGVVGSELIEVDALGVQTSIGTLSTANGRVVMADNGVQLMLVDGVAGYLVTLASNTFATISDPDFPAGTQTVTFQDGYFIVPKRNTGQFYISDLRDGSSWSALDFGDAEGSPDILITLMSNGRDLWLLGEHSSEVWYDSGNPDFPFERVPGTFNETGCAAWASLAKMLGSIFFLGGSNEGNGVVFQSQGFQLKRISTHALEQAIAGYESVDDAFGYCYQQEGHWFYVLTFPTGDATWVYDLTTGMWHQRAYRDPVYASLGRHRSAAHAFFDGKNLVLDYANGRICELSMTTYTDDGDTLVRIRTCPHVHDEMRRLTFAWLELDMETGVGLVTGQGSDPQVMLQVSNDGGVTWGNELWRSMGRLGEYKARVRWHRLGRSLDRVFKIQISDPVKCVLLGAVAEVEAEE